MQHIKGFKMIRSSSLAKELGLSKNKVIELANEGLIPSIQLPSGHFRFDLDEVIAALRPVKSGVK
jgi:predicted site-specific integrase-resolvase